MFNKVGKMDIESDSRRRDDDKRKDYDDSNFD